MIRAELALVLEPLWAARAKARQRGGQGGALLHQKSDEATSPLTTIKEIAKIAGVSRDTIHKAKATVTERRSVAVEPEGRAGIGSRRSTAPTYPHSLTPREPHCSRAQTENEDHRWPVTTP